MEGEGSGVEEAVLAEIVSFYVVPLSILEQNHIKLNQSMKKLIAIPSSNGLLDEHFGHCRQFALLSVEENKIVSKSLIDAPPHEPGVLPKYLAEKGVTDVIAGGMGNRAIQLFNQHNVNVFVGAPKLSPAEITEGFLNRTLQFSANYCDH